MGPEFMGRKIFWVQKMLGQIFLGQKSYFKVKKVSWKFCEYLTWFGQDKAGSFHLYSQFPWEMQNLWWETGAGEGQVSILIKIHTEIHAVFQGD